MSQENAYNPPQVWTWEKESGGKFASVNRPVAGPTLVPVAYPGARLVLGGAETLGTVEVVSYDGRGREVGSKMVEIGPEAAVEVKVPGRAALLRVEPQDTSVEGALVLTNADGAAVVGLRELLREGLAPDVRPGLR